MCGFLGQFTLRNSDNISIKLKNGLKKIEHRGPDDSGLSVETIGNGTLSLGHKRLSIIDLSSSGHQPMHSADNRFTIVFNGEIYN